ncbi:hypothetical protein GCM10009779_58990 [Polymorphospora rubra]|uniref:Uncharacterized protein n=1 Tax=Polymorphospora rubra TaxID=338584 RepID=A0A810NEN3_9ACTN|nr:hypothetical protein Prubr_69540 [Polymorphospora rubra]
MYDGDGRVGGGSFLGQQHRQRPAEGGAPAEHDNVAAGDGATIPAERPRYLLDRAGRAVRAHGRSALTGGTENRFVWGGGGG